MNHSHDIVRRTEFAPAPYGSIAVAKANLVSWAEDCDARSGTSSRRMATIATTGMFAVIGGMVIARIVASSSRKSSGAGGWMRKAIATLIFRAVMSRVQQHILTRTPRA